MTDPAPKPTPRRSRISVGESIALAALIISGLGLWNGWRTRDEGPATVVERKTAVPLALRGQVTDDGEALVITPVEPGHALDSATIAANGKMIEVGSDGRVTAHAVRQLVGDPADGAERGSLAVTARSRYVEAGRDRENVARYRIDYRWRDGGLFGGRDLRLSRFSRA